MRTVIRCCSVLVLLIAVATVTVADERPNIVVIMVDDMGYSDLGCYGSEIRTPNLDALAARGIRYTQMYNTSKCWTTRISLLTGIYHNRSGRDFEHTALASEVLGPAGYKTWWSGKHHAEFNPVDRGFDHFSGFLGGAINFWNPGGSTARAGEPVPGWGSSYQWAFDDKVVDAPYLPEKSFYATDTFTDWATDWLEDSKADTNPFFLYVAYNAPHWPLHAHPADIKKYAGVYDGGYADIRRKRFERQTAMGLWNRTSTSLSNADFGSKEWESLSPKERGNERLRMEVHAAMVDSVDQNVGRLVSTLKNQGKLKNTLILFLTDNGASAERPKTCKVGPNHPWGSVGTFNAIGQKWAQVCNTPMRFWKVTSHEGGVCTPMIAHWPMGISKPGTINRTPCHLVDLLPTWMELAGASAKYPGTSEQASIPPLDGQSIAATFRGETLVREKPMFFQYGGGRAVRLGDWKLVARGKSSWELYNLRVDRTETKDLASSEPERVEQLETLYKQWQSAGSEVEKAKAPRKKTKK